MQLSNAPSKFPLPFAASGGKNSIPTASQIAITPGAASLTDGFPPLTRTPISAGGVPPFGLDMNGILYLATAINQWDNAGAGYVWDGTFASNIGGYPQGARVLRSDGTGYWLNTVDNNTNNPEASTATAAAGWVPDLIFGVTPVTMSNTNVTLTPVQYGKPIVEITGTLTTNVQLIFPALAGEWFVINNTTGSYTITCKTPSGGGTVVNGAQKIVCDGTNIYGINFGVTGRTILSSGANYYVATTGNDSTGNGLSGNPWATLPHAYQWVLQNIDTAGYNVTINVADGTYSAGVNVTAPLVGGGQLLFVGDTSTPANCIISSSSNCFTSYIGIPTSIAGFKCISSGGAAIAAVNGGQLYINGKMEYGTCGSQHFNIQGVGSYINIGAYNYTISGGATAHWACGFGANSIAITGGSVITLTGTPNFSSAFATIGECALCVCNNLTFSGSATGQRFTVSNGGHISTNGGGANYLPGNSAGSGTNYATSPYGLYT